MKCADYEQMSRHLEDETISREKIAMDTHLLDCLACRDLYAECQAEREALRMAICAPELPESFTEDIMAQLEPYPTVLEETQVQHPVRKTKKRKWKRWAYVAAGTLLAITAAASVSPSFASYLSDSIFNRDNQQIDPGLQMASANGFIQHGNYHVTDNGVTLRVLDIVADPTRLALSYTLEKEDGSHLDPNFDLPNTREQNHVYLADKDGKKLADLSSWSNNDPYGVIGFQLDSDVPEKVYVHFELARVGGILGLGAAEGKWNLRIPVDMKKGQDATRKVAVNRSHTTKQGVTIDINGLTFAPTKSQLEVTTGLTESAKKKLQEMAEQEKRIGLADEDIGSYVEGTYGISYRLLDEKGHVVAGKSGPVRISHEQEKNAIESTGMNAPSGRTVWRDGFVPLSQAKQLTFILDAIDMEEAADFSLAFAPDDLQKNPITKLYQGNTITVKSFKVNRDWDIKKQPPFFEDKSHAIIELAGVQRENIGTLRHWTVTDENGRVYRAMPSGSEGDPDASGNLTFTSTLRIYGLQHKPEKLTLSLTRIMKRHTDVNWKADIPLPK